MLVVITLRSLSLYKKYDVEKITFYLLQFIKYKVENQLHRCHNCGKLPNKDMSILVIDYLFVHFSYVLSGTARVTR